MSWNVSKSKILILCLLVAFGTAASVQAAGGDEEQRSAHRAVVRELHGAHHSGTFLGVQLTELTSELRIHFGVPETVGVMVSKVVTETPAERAGVRVGDIITRIDGVDVSTARDLARAIQKREEGDVVDLEVWREKRIEMLSPTLAKREMKRQMRFHCGEGSDCDMKLDCGGDCEVEVTCTDGDCECSVNGEVKDCEEIPATQRFRMHRRHHDE